MTAPLGLELKKSLCQSHDEEKNACILHKTFYGFRRTVSGSTKAKRVSASIFNMFLGNQGTIVPLFLKQLNLSVLMWEKIVPVGQIRTRIARSLVALWNIPILCYHSYLELLHAIWSVCFSYCTFHFFKIDFSFKKPNIWASHNLQNDIKLPKIGSQ